MAVYEVLRFPDERLRTIAKPVEKVDDSIKAIVANMFDTMKDENGIGLAATQVDIHQQIIVMDVSENQDNPLVFINPKITRFSDEKKLNEEGCLSVPGTYAEVQRSVEVTIEALDVDGSPFKLEASGLLAICIQHEMDHLNGKLFVDYLSPLKRQRIKNKLEKAARRA
jgi:peptide deformylase